MIFQIDIAFALELLGLIAAAGLLLGAQKGAGLAAGLAKTIGVLGIAASLAGMACTGYYALQYREAGYFQKPLPMNASPEGSGGMEGECPMMKKMKEKMMKDGGGPGEEAPPSPHEGHHPGSEEN